MPAQFDLKKPSFDDAVSLLPKSDLRLDALAGM